MLIFEEIFKEKTMVSIKTNEGEYFFNFANCETNFCGITDGFRFTRETHRYSNFIYLLNKYVQRTGYNKFATSLSLMKIETFWFHLDNINIFDVPEKNPKGFIEFCSSNRLLISQEALDIYRIIKKNNLINDKNRISHLRMIYNNTSLYFSTLELLTRKQILLLLDLHSKISYPLFCMLLSFLNDNHNEVFELINTRKDIEIIIEILRDKRNEKINKGIKLTQSFYSPAIDGITYEDLIVVVPQSIDDLVNEGIQQHNCVGEYYNESIADEEDFIFFIRKKSNPKKSYITCRYSISDKELAEINTKYNQEDYNEEEYNFALKIVEMLNVF